MKKQIPLMLLAVVAGFNAFAQIEIDKPVNLTSTNPADAKVTGIKQVSAAQDAVSAEVLQKGSLLYAAGGGTSAAYTLSLAPAVTVYTDGMEVRFKAPVANAAGVTLNVNGVGAKLIKKNVSANLAASDITAGQLVSVIYDASADVFQLASRIEQLSNTATPGTYNNVTVNAQGLVTSGSNVAYAPATAVSGSTNFIPKFTSASAIGNSVIQENSGNIGIGTAGGTMKLRVAGDEEATGQIRATGWISGTGTGPGMEIGYTQSNGYLLSYNRTTSSYAPIRIAGSAIDIRHSDASSDIYVSSSGKVGIGNSDALTALHIRGTQIGSFTGTTRGSLTIDAPYNAGNFNNIDFLHDNNANPIARIGVFANGSGSKIMLGTSNDYGSGITNTAMTIDQNGNVGVGTGNTTASVKLKVAGDIEANNQIRATGWLLGAGTGHGHEIGVASGYGYLLSYDRSAGTYQPTRIVGSTIDIRHSDASSDLFVSSSGQVGVGTNTPGAPLTIMHDASYSFPNPGTSAKGAINIRATTSNRQTGITFSQSGVDNAQAGIYVHQDNSAGTHMYLATTGSYATGPQTRVMINNLGKVGIGTINPTSALHVNGDVATLNGQVRHDFVAFNTTDGNAIPIHIKTNIPYQSNVMWMIEVKGYNYGPALIINSACVGYAYSGATTIINQQNTNYSAGVSISQYYSSDGFVVIRLAPTTNSYYLGFAATGFFTNPNGNGHAISATVVQQSGNL